MIQLIKIDPTQMLGEKPNVLVPSGGFIAGGAVRRWFSGKEALSDVDVFFPSADIQKKYIEELEKDDFKQTYATKNALTYYNGKIQVQCIQIKYYQDVSALLDSFDYTLCQFAWDGKDIYSTPLAMVSVLRNHLGAHEIRPDFAVDSLRRAFKYAKKGFYPCNGTLLKIADSLRGLTAEQILDAVTISPKGGRSILRID